MLNKPIFNRVKISMERLRKILVVSVMSITVLSMSMLAVPMQVGATASAGDLIKTSSSSAVYYLAADGKRYVFPTEQTYFSWYSDFSGVLIVSQSEFENYTPGANVTMRPGTKLIQEVSMETPWKVLSSKVYAIEPGGKKIAIPDADTAVALYGANWESKIQGIPSAFITSYTDSGKTATATAYPTGSLVKWADSTDVYYVDSTGEAQKIANEAAFTANRFKWSDVITAPTSVVKPTAGTEITGAVATLTDTSSGAGGTAGAGTGLTVALASDTPASATYIRDTGAAVAQAVAGFTKINFTASNDGDIKVTTLKLTRSGISADTDLGTLYLYDGDTQIAQNTSFSSKIVTFNDAAGLFTVTKGTTKSITVKADIAALNASVSGIILGVNAASDITTDGASVSGTFPVNGNQMAVGTVADLGYASIATYTTFPATMDPGKTGEELWRFNVTANDQDMMIEKIKMTLVGTIATTDVTNFKLDVAGTQIGSTVESMNASKEVIFDLSSAPYKITSGQTKTVVVKGDVPNGSGRAFKFTIRKVGDFIVKDNSYGIYVAPLKGPDAFTIIDANASGDGTNINNGNITVGIATDSPSGNVASAATNVPLAKFTYKANGEDIKVTYINVRMNKEVTDSDLKNGKLYWNGSQVGSTDAYVQDETTVVYTANQIIKAGETANIEYRADLIHGGTGGVGLNATSAGIPADQTIVVSLVAGTTDATGQSSLANVTTTAATGRTLTVKTGLLSVAKNISMADYTTSLPTGVAGATDVKVGSFVLTAGAGENVTVTQLTVGDLSGDSNFGDNFQNLVLKNGTTTLATTQGTLSGTAGADYAFSLSPAVKINAGQQYVVDCYADILSGAPGFNSAVVGLEFVSASATGDNTGTDAAPTDTPSLQNVVIGTAGAMAVAVDGDSPLSQQLVMGSTGNEVAKFKFTETSSAEDITISAITLTDTVSTTAAGSIANLVITDGVTTYGTASSLAAAGTAAITLTSPITVPKGSNKIITVKSDVTAYPNAVSQSTHVFSISAFTARGASSGKAVDSAASSGTAGTMTAVRTKLTITKGAAGTAARAADTVIANFTLSNSANVASQAAALSDIAINISTSGGTWATTSKVINLYKNTVASANKVGSFNGLDSVALGGWINGSAGQYDDNPIASSTKDISISAGSSVTLIVAADTTGAPTGAGVTGVISVTIPASNGVTWEDGISTGISAVTSVDTLPLTVSLSGI